MISTGSIYTLHENLGLTILTLSQTTKCRLFQTERVCRRQFQIGCKWQKVLQMGRKQLVMSNFSLSHSVFKGLALQTRKNQGLFGKGLNRGRRVLPDD